jgi:hypothetical protein
MLRLLRVAFSVLCGIGCLLLVALWMRSDSWWDAVYGRYQLRRAFGANSLSGRVQLYESPQSVPEPSHVVVQSIRLTPAEQLAPITIDLSQRTSRWAAFGFYFGHFPHITEVIVPHWFLVTFTGALGAIPWIEWRFSLWTLFVATTLAALGLGVMVWVLS